MTTSTRARTTVAAVAVVSVFGLSACGSDSLDNSSSSSAAASGSAGGSSTSVNVSASADNSLASLVPADIKKKGTLTVGSDASYAPNEFMQVGSQDIVGMDVDLFKAVAAKLGLKTTWQNASFSSIIPGLGSKYDVGVSSFTINPDREKSVTMVSYLTAGVQWAAPKGNPKKVDPKNPCGLTIGVQTGTVEQDELNAMNKTGKCKSKPIKIVPEEGQDKVNLDLQAGKTDAMSADSPITQYAVKQSGGKLETLGDVTEAAPYGVVLPKNQAQLAKAIVAAFESLKKDGTYANIFKKWGLTTGQIDKFEINPKVSS